MTALAPPNPTRISDAPASVNAPMEARVMRPDRRPARGARIAVVIPQFPQQTHVAWWRVMKQMRWWGADAVMASTRRPDEALHCHPDLIDEVPQTLYLWPPRWGKLVASMVSHPRRLWNGVRYVAGLRESSWPQRLRKLPLLLPAAELRRQADALRLDAVFVHSCADAAHIAASCRAMGGPAYGLRLGGDLEVYGKDHRSKMADAEFIAAGAAAYVPQLIEECGVDPERAFWTWVGVDCRTFTPGRERDAREDDAESHELHVVTVARLTDTKGHVDGLEAIARLKQEGVRVRHSIAGRGPEEPAIRACIDRLRLEDQVELLGALDQSAVITLLREADVFLLCSFGLGESTPAVVSEAMACGVPAVCTVIGGTMDMIDHGVDGLLVPQRDPDAIAEALRSLASEACRLETMSAAALRSSAKFDCRQTARRVLEGFGLDCEPAGNASR